MLPPKCLCPCCGRPLHLSISWARLVTEEPTVVEHQGAWGRESVAIGGAAQIAVRCSRCGTESEVGRYFPVAEA